MAERLPGFPPRPLDAHKGSMGRVLLVAGSRGMAGAAALAAEAVLRGGAGYVVAGVPGSLFEVLSVLVPCAVLHLCGDAARQRLQEGDFASLQQELERAEVLAIGPGLGRADGTARLTGELLAAAAARRLPAVVDADALYHLASLREAWPHLLHPGVILTPHPGEAARLLGSPGPSERVSAVLELASRSGATVVLKGAGSLVGAGGRPPWRNATGNPGMATAGCGDVLTGLIAALLARGMSTWDAARLGVHLHGRAGDLAAAELGQESMIAGDLLRFLPAALRAHPQSC